VAMGTISRHVAEIPKQGLGTRSPANRTSHRPHSVQRKIFVLPPSFMYELELYRRCRSLGSSGSAERAPMESAICLWAGLLDQHCLYSSI
jgi:hypothetical protein